MKYQFSYLNNKFQSSNINFYIQYMKSIHTYAQLISTQIHIFMIYLTYHKYNFNTYIKIHPYVIVKYFLNTTNLVIIATNGTYQSING